MSVSVSVWFVFLLALVGANAPFVSQRRFLVGPRLAKPLSLRLLELGAMFFLVGVVALGLERRVGQVAVQGWEFFAVHGALFLTLSFPGFVYRYLLKYRD